ncbi:DUF1439 domain-containing protein [Volucribacter amazonae]|uniref:DUF1439 domain-containing protein n=1 Tax=Volucribacter amazonae TaxID=256731 RepID=A0A9X4PBU2_9PAST|nr:DUF1439 domain-containing protein [Volucribacter amazonae]MDG6896300.1 hypothetical protein [Volucribacter amazonae]
MLHYLKLFVIIFIAYPSFAQASLFSLSQAQINQYLQNNVQIEDQFGLAGLLNIDYVINDIQAEIGQNDPNRIELSANLQGLFKLASDQFKGNIHLVIDTIPYYDPDKGAIYLTDIRILRWAGKPDEYMNQLQSIMPLLSKSLPLLFNHQPIYQLDESDPKQFMIKKLAKAIRVEKGRLVLEGNLL